MYTLTPTRPDTNSSVGPSPSLRKLPWVMALATMLGGCAALPGATESSEVAALRSEVQALQASLDNTQKSLLLNDAAQADQRAEVNTELKNLDAALARLPKRLSEACQQAVSAPPQTCTEAPPVVKFDDRMVLGELEHVWLEPPGISLTARIDTGAESSSVNAQNLVEFERDGDDWVRFEWALKGQTTSIERPIERYVRIVQQADPAGTRRPVVSLRLRIGDIEDDFDFSLADRSHLDHQMILGRNFLTDVAVVDVGRKFVQPAISSNAE